MNGRRSRSLHPALALIPALGLVIGLGSVASASLSTPAKLTAQASSAPSPVPSSAAEATAIAAIKSLNIGQHTTNHQVRASAHSTVRGLTQVQSTNWAGYADTGSSFSQVSASWTEPSATCSKSKTQLAAFWVGIDGFTSSSVEQDGTLIECSRGKAFQ